MSGSLFQNIPTPATPMVDPQSGIMDIGWYRFFLAMWNRTGGASPSGAGVPGGLDTNVQYNNAGSFGGLTNVQLTARIQHFSDVLSGAATASGGGTTNFLRADGNWTAPTAGGTAGGNLSGSYPNPVVAKVNGVAYSASPGTNTVPVVTGANTVTYETVPVLAGGTGATTATGTAGSVVLSIAPTLAGATVDGDGAFHLTSQTDGAAAATGTLTNAPHAGNPNFWVPMMVNGVAGWVPWWHA